MAGNITIAFCPQLYVKEPTFAKAMVGRPASAKTLVWQALAHRARILVEDEKLR
jgi:hypothetical protein